MDITTVITVINTIDAKLKNYALMTGETMSFVESKETGLIWLRDHLQEWVDDRLSAMETTTGQGE